MKNEFVFPQICHRDIKECLVCRKRLSAKFTNMEMQADNQIINFRIYFQHKVEDTWNGYRHFSHPWMFDVLITFRSRSDRTTTKLVFHIMNGKVGYLFVPYMSSNVLWPREIRAIGYDVTRKHELEKFFRFLMPVVMLNFAKFYSFNDISTNVLNEHLLSMLNVTRLFTGSVTEFRLTSQFKRGYFARPELTAIENYLDAISEFVKTGPTYNEIYSFVNRLQDQPPFKYIAHYSYNVYNRTDNSWQETISPMFGNIRVKNKGQ